MATRYRGSPIELRSLTFSPTPNAARVLARGPGLDHGIIGSHTGRFICETRGAGPGQLRVRVHGPKDAFDIRMSRSSTKDRKVEVRYNQTELGEYMVEVKWSDEHVPGSPFMVFIVGNERDLRRAKQEHPINPMHTWYPPLAQED